MSLTSDELDEIEVKEDSLQNVVAIFICMLLGSVCREINKKTKIPYTPMLFTTGMGVGYMCCQYP